MSQSEVSNMKTKPPLVPLGTLLGRELRNSCVEKPTIKYGQAALAKKGEDLFLIKPDCQRILGNPSTSFSVFAIFDGHNGISAAIFAKENLLNNVLSAIPQGISREEWLQALPRALVAGFVKTDIEFQQKGETSGTTVTFVVIDGWTVTVASVGDSRCIVDTQGGVVVLLTVDHRLEENVEERERVTASGGEVGRLNVFGGNEVGPLRCWPGGLCLSRSIGDTDVGEFIVPVPHVKQVKLSNAGGRLIIASDGIWDALSSDMAAQACRGLPAELAAKLVVKINHTALRVALDSGKDLGMPDGVLINGKGPYQYNSTLVPDGINYETIKVDPGKTYRVRVHNVGVSTCLNFRIQNHNLLLAETEGYYVSQQNYTSLDIHVGQSYSFLVTMDQNASSDYYIVASARFVNQSLWQRVTGVAILQYSNSKGKAAGPLPDPPNDAYDTSFAVNQAMSIRQNVSASGARPNPQGSFHYGSIKVTDTYVLKSVPPMMVDGKLRATLNGISFVNPDTPVRLADKYNVKGSYKLDFPSRPLNRPPRTDRSLINATYKGFIEIILQNNDTVVQSFHMDGYSFFVVGMAYGEWTENSKGSYNNWDAISRSTTQVFPGGWTAVLVSLDNVGVWNLRAENLDRWYLGQETYMRIINPEPDPSNKTEFPMPDNALFCGALSHMQKPQKGSSSAVPTIRGQSKLYVLLVAAFCAVISELL